MGKQPDWEGRVFDGVLLWVVTGVCLGLPYAATHGLPFFWFFEPPFLALFAAILLMNKEAWK